MPLSNAHDAAFCTLHTAFQLVVPAAIACGSIGLNRKSTHNHTSRSQELHPRYMRALHRNTHQWVA